ncbi:unnamed protein product [Fusarium equiseti]|uniref:Nucleoside phosphorylase domain-containing protein n=1 Tax=Fusarium equiseti TaxID=61235 RepID=A0A8J2J3I1_FUSEQ|nr:unnamed protein product [Fusarium equiseti]
MSRRRVFEGDEITFAHHSKRLCSGLTSYDRYTVAWLCALHIEMAAARAMLDEEHHSPPKIDSNSYVLGTIQGQHVVIACLPASAYGTNNAAIVMSNLKRTFPNIDVCLMVGIGGGVPTNKADIRLGDIVVGTRVMQYDLGKTINGELQRTGVYKHPGISILTVVSNLRSRHELEGSRVPAILKSKMEDHATYALPTEPDRLFRSTYNHAYPDFSCDECDQERLEVRKTRSSTDPVIYYGAVASGNQVVKDASYRDKIGGELDVLCFEMEAAGLMDIESCLPIRGICDYSDSHKAKGWQRYAAATAAAYAYELLEVRGRDDRDVEANHPPIADEESTSDQRHEEILKLLDFEAIDARKTTIKAAHSKTCRWFLKHEDYLAWKDPAKVSEHHGFLWIRGKPGAGKSTIMKFIYLETRKKDKKNQILTASFFFNARGEALEKTISGMCRSLLLQLFKGFPDLQCVLDDSDLLPQSQITCPSLNSLKDLLRSAVLKLDQRSFTCFIDALDECDEQQAMDLVYFFEDIAETCTENGVRLRICFSSRHYPYIDIDRGMRLTVENQEGHAGDLESYIKSNLRIKDPALVAQLQGRMLVKASGVFLWVVLVVDVLNDENRRGRLNLRNRLEQVPSELSELFKDILRRDNSNAEELQLCLLWILLSKRPLKPEEYYHALWSGLVLEGLADSEMPSVDTTDATDCFYKSVVNSSKGLAEITKAKQPTVQFIHESVRDFLIKDNGLAEIWPELKANWEGFGHDKLKRCCSFYFRLIDTFVDGDDAAGRGNPHEPSLVNFFDRDLSNYPFADYASRFVLDHADSAQCTHCQQEFLRKFPRRDWISIVSKFEKHRVRRFTLDAELLYILAERGHSSLIRTRLKVDPLIDSLGKKERYGHPLTAAMAKGHRASVLALLGLSSPLQDGVDITSGIAANVNCSLKNPTPLTYACLYGYLDIATLLVRRGASIDEDDTGLLDLALRSGRKEIAKWLIDVAQVLRPSYDAVISLAVEQGHTEVVAFLLDQGVPPDNDIDDTLIFAEPILVDASARGYDAIVKLILAKGGNCEIANNFGRRPIHCANSDAVIETLIKHGIDIHAQDRQGETCLWNAMRQLSLGGLKSLLKKGANVNARRFDGQTCLFEAVRRGRLEATDILCRNGADVNARDGAGNTCIHFLAANLIKLSPMLEILLEYEIDINAANFKGQTCLHLLGERQLVSNRRDEFFQSLEKQGIDINCRDLDGNTPLHLATQRQKFALARFLIAHGADTSIRNNQGYRPSTAYIGIEDRGLDQCDS